MNEIQSLILRLCRAYHKSDLINTEEFIAAIDALLYLEEYEKGKKDEQDKICIYPTVFEVTV